MPSKQTIVKIKNDDSPLKLDFRFLSQHVYNLKIEVTDPNGSLYTYFEGDNRRGDFAIRLGRTSDNLNRKIVVTWIVLGKAGSTSDFEAFAMVCQNGMPCPDYMGVKGKLTDGRGSCLSAALITI